MVATWLDLLIKDGQRVGLTKSILKYFPPLELHKIFLVKEHTLFSKKTLSDILFQFVRLCHYLAHVII